MTTTSIGNEGFFWFLGKVEDRDDPLKLGRVRVRIFNHHSNKASMVPSNQLPWATILNSPNSASFNKVGISPTGIMIGSTVVGFFLDGADGNNPVIMGTIAGIPDNNQSLHDVSQEAREINSIQKTTIGSEPSSPYRTKYPYNKVIKTERGHVIEIDDTPDAERIHVYHKSGSYLEINETGRLVIKSVDDQFEITAKNKEVFINGNVNMQINGSYTLNASGPVKINGSTVNINNGSMGAARIGDTADTGDPGGSVGSNKIESGSGTVFIGD